jgi:hypothetical protein
MVDFGQVGTASLWKSGPLFSTGTKEAELMLEEPGLNPRSPAARYGDRCPVTGAAVDTGRVDPNLSTALGGRWGLRSTGRGGKEEVG